MPATQTDIGKTVYLLGALAETSFGPAYEDQPRPCSLIGLFDVVEYLPFEPSNYVWTPGFLVVPHGYDGDLDDGCYFVAAQTYEEQVHPAMHARMLVQERDMANAEEMECY